MVEIKEGLKRISIEPLKKDLIIDFIEPDNSVASDNGNNFDFTFGGFHVFKSSIYFVFRYPLLIENNTNSLFIFVE